MAFGYNAPDFTGVAQGLTQGVNAGSGIARNRIDAQQLEQQQVDQRLDLLNQHTANLLKAKQEAIANAPQRGPALDSLTQAIDQQVQDGIKVAQAFGSKGQMLGQQWASMSSTIDQTTKTLSETQAAKIQGEFEGTMGAIDSMGVPAPQAATPGQGAAPPSPASAATAAPPVTAAQATPMRLAPPEGETPEQTAAAVNEYAASQPAPVQTAQAERDTLRQRALEKYFPPTEAEKEKTKEYAKRFTKLADEADDAVSAHIGIQRAKQLVKEGIISGAAAGVKKSISKYSGGSFPYDSDTVARTEEFESIMYGQVLKFIKPLGTGTAVSETDRNFITKMVGGDIELNEDSIKRILKLGEGRANDIISRYNRAAPPELKMDLPGANASPDAVPDKAAPGEGGFEADAEGWVDLGNGIRLRKK